MKRFNPWIILILFLYPFLLGTTYTGDLTTGGRLRVFGTGPHAIGGSALGRLQFRLTGTFTSDGGSTEAASFWHDSVLIGAPGDTVGLMGLRLSPDITTQGATETITRISTVRIDEPNITIGSGDIVTNAVTLYIAAAPTEATNNLSFHIDAGFSQFDETISLISVTDDAAENPVCRASNGRLSRGSAGCNISSRRYKQNIQDLQYGLKEILQLRPVSFQRILSKFVPSSERIDPDIPAIFPDLPTPIVTLTRYGLIAEEVANVLPEIIAYEPDDPSLIQTYDYRTMHAILIKAIQEQQKQINILLAR